MTSRLSRIVFRTFGEGFPTESSGRFFVRVLGLTVFLSLCGMVFVAGGILPPDFRWTASVIIILTGLTTFLSELRAGGFTSTLIRFLLVAGVTFLVEFVGVRTGFPFGAYTYTDTLGLQVMGVPIAIAFAWYATVMNTRLIAWRWYPRATPFAIAIIAGALTVALDIALEPMASFVNEYWIWHDRTVPLQNYVAWFSLGAAAVLLVTLRDRNPGDAGSPGMWRTSMLLLGLQLALFLLTNIVNGHVLPSLLAVVLVLLIAAGSRKRRIAVTMERQLSQ